jgi:hypothetical protein
MVKITGYMKMQIKEPHYDITIHLSEFLKLKFNTKGQWRLLESRTFIYCGWECKMVYNYLGKFSGGLLKS